MHHVLLHRQENKEQNSQHCWQACSRGSHTQDRIADSRCNMHCIGPNGWPCHLVHYAHIATMYQGICMHGLTGLASSLAQRHADKIAHAIHLAPGTRSTLCSLPNSPAAQSASRRPTPPGYNRLGVQLERSGTKQGCCQRLQRTFGFAVVCAVAARRTVLLSQQTYSSQGCCICSNGRVYR
jgi:hypothetical protein